MDFRKENIHVIPPWFRSNRLQIFCKIGVLKNSAKFMETHLCWSLFSKRLQVSWPETSLKRDFSRGIFLWILKKIFEKTYLQNTSGCLLVLISPFQPALHALITLFFLFVSNNCNYGNLLSLFFTIIYQEINVNVVKTTCLSNDLLMHIRENTDFARQKPQQLPSAKANFEGCLEIIKI